MNTAIIDRIISSTLHHVRQEFPHSELRIFESADDILTPRLMHPIFYGSLDWHSCVHGYWLLARALERAPNSADGRLITQLFDSQFTKERVATERAFFMRPAQGGFERPYGWVWLLKLAAQLKTSAVPQAAIWYAQLSPLAELLAQRLTEYLPKLSHPIRSGQHNNTAFALTLAFDYAEAVGDSFLSSVIHERAKTYFLLGGATPTNEPGGEDFLSPAWQQALLMQRVLPLKDYRIWFPAFISGAGSPPNNLFEPVYATDRNDGRLAHLDGLNLSRAWCMARIATSFKVGSREHSQLMLASAKHLHVSNSQIHTHYMGEHWLATYLFLALDL